MRELKAAVLDFYFGVPKLAPLFPAHVKVAHILGFLFEISPDKYTFVYFFFWGGGEQSNYILSTPFIPFCP